MSWQDWLAMAAAIMGTLSLGMQIGRWIGER